MDIHIKGTSGKIKTKNFITMNKPMKNILILLILLLVPTVFLGQETDQVEMADALFQSGKIYVVVTVLSVIFVGIVGYLIVIDRKISKLEKEINKK